MRKLKGMVLGAVVAGALVLPAAPAHASCNTDIGDVCKAVDVVCQAPAAQKLIGYCQS